MKFLFDFGDSWRFELKLERIDAPNEAARKPQLIDSAGEAPAQYRAWE